MANNIGGLLVTIGLNAAEFITGLTKAERQAQQWAANIRGRVEGVEDGFVKAAAKIGAAIGAGLTVNAFVGMVRGAIDAQEELSNLGKRAGITGSELSSLSTAATLTHTGLEDVAGMSAKLSKALLDFGKEGAQSTVVLRALGLSAKDVPALLAAPAEAVLKFAKLINSLPEGGTKAAAQLLILGKAGGTTSAFLGQLATQTALLKTRTDEEIEAAKAFNDKLTEMGIKAADLRTRFANALLPTLDAIVDAFNNLSTAGGGAAGKLEQLKNSGDLQEWARNGAIAVGTLAESLILVGRIAIALTGSFRSVGADIDELIARTNAPSQKLTGSFGFSPEEAAKAEADYQAAINRRIKIKEQADQNYIDLIQKNGAFITDALKQSFEMQDRVTKAGVEALANSDRNDRLNAVNNVAAADAAKRAAAAKAAAVQAALNAANAGSSARKILDGQLKSLEDFIKGEQETLQDRNRFLNSYYQDDQLGLRDFFAGRRAALDEAIQKELAAYDKQAELLRAFAKKAKPEDRIDAENKLADVLAKRSKLEQDGATKGIELFLEETRAIKGMREAIEQTSIALAEMRGDTVTAAAAGFDFANRKILAQLAELKKSPLSSDQSLAGIGERDLAAMRELVVRRAELNKATEEYAMTLDELSIAQARIQIAEESGLVSSVVAYQQRQSLNEEYVQALKSELIALEAIAKASGKREDIIRVAKLRLEMEKIAAEGLIAEQKVIKDFADSISDSFSSSFEGFINGTKSAKDAFKSFVDDIQSMLVKLALKKLMNQILGTESGGPDIFSVFAKLLTSYAGGAAGGAGGIADIGAGGGGGLGYAANGADFTSGAYMVGERGPEIVVPPGGSKILPNSALKSNVVNIHQNINVMPGANTASARQAAGRLRDATLGAVRDR